MLVLYSLLLARSFAFQTYISTGEVRQWDLQKLFGGLNDPTYAVDDPQFTFGVDDPIVPSGFPRNHIKAANTLIAAKPQLTRIGHYWLNHFAFIETDGSRVNLFYSENSQDDMTTTPGFLEYIPVSNDLNFICYDVDYVDSSNFVVDCSDISKQPIIDYLIILNKDGTQPSTNQFNTNQYQKDTVRILRLFQTETKHYLFRGVPYYGTGDGETVIDNFLLNGSNPPVLGTQKIDTKLLSQLFNLPASFKLEMIDFQINYLGHIYILDKTAVFICKFDDNGDWSKINMYPIQTFVPQAFDYNEYIDDDGKRYDILAILFDKSFQVYINDSTEPKRYSLPFTIQARPASIQISLNFIVVQYAKTNYLYNINSDLLIYRKALSDGTLYLCNPHYPDYIAISSIKSERFLLSNGYLYTVESSKMCNNKNLRVMATTGDGKKREYDLQYSVVDPKDESLKQINDYRILSEPIYKDEQIEEIVPFMSGPNIQYANVADKSGIDLKFNSLKNLQISAHMPNAKDILFQDLLSFSPARNYLFFQLANLDVLIWECGLGAKTGVLDDCKVDKNITTVKATLDAKHFQWWVESDAVHMAFCDSQHGLQIWKLVGLDLSQETKIIFTDPISQILRLQNQLYVLTKDTATIWVYQTLPPYQRLEVINEVLVKSLGFVKKWSPTMMWGNPKYQSHLIFIKNPDLLQIIKFTNELVLIDSIPYVFSGETSVSIYKESFFVISKNDKTNSIQEYSLTELNDIQLLKNLPNYGYEFISPLAVAQSDENGIIFIHATIVGKSFLLVYQPDVLLRDSLIRIIEFTPALSQKNKLQISAAGDEYTYFYLNDGDQQIYSLLYKNIQVIASAKISSNMYYNEVQKAIQVKNEVTVLQFNEVIGVVNTMDQISTQQNFIPQTFEVEKKANIAQIPLGNNWYTGQVVDFSIECKQCPNLIKVLNTVNPINNFKDLNQTIIDIDNYDDKNAALLFKDKLMLADIDNIVRATIDFDQPNSCEQLQSHPTQNLIFTVCAYNGKYHAYLVYCSNRFSCAKVKNPIDLPDLQAITKVRFLNDNILLISSLGKLYVYYITYDKLNDWSLILKNVLDYGLNDFESLGYVDLDKNQYYLITCLDKADNALFLNTRVDNSFNLVILKTSSIPLYSLIKTNKQFSYEDTDYYFVQPIGSIKVLTNGMLQLRALIITSDVAHYLFEFVLSQDRVYNSGVIAAVFNEYSDWITLQKFYYFDSFFSIAYNKDDKYLVAVYQIPEHIINDDKLKLGVETHTMIGGTEGNFNKKQGPLIMYIFRGLTNFQLYSNVVPVDPNSPVVTNYQIYLNGPQLAVTDTLNLNEQQSITITARNDFSQANIQTTLKEIMDNVVEKDSNNLWWILLLTFGLIGLTAFIAYYVWRRKKQRELANNKQDFSLLNRSYDV